MAKAKEKRKFGGEIYLQIYGHPVSKGRATEIKKDWAKTGMRVRVVKRSDGYYPFVRKKDTKID
jgi:hypothetical protein